VRYRLEGSQRRGVPKRRYVWRIPRMPYAIAQLMHGPLRHRYNQSSSRCENGCRGHRSRSNSHTLSYSRSHHRSRLGSSTHLRLLSWGRLRRKHGHHHHHSWLQVCCSGTEVTTYASRDGSDRVQMLASALKLVISCKALPPPLAHGSSLS
jgi:hypothetical protein